MYVLLDGFDLGVGIMLPFAADDDARTLIMNSVAPIWDGNETWLVLGGIGLFAAFPLAFAIIIPAMYFPILFMLLGLIFRGVAFEFRLKAQRSRFLWDHSFFWGSLIATFAQGVVLGSFVQGFDVKDNQFAGTRLRLVPAVPARGRRRPRVRLPAARLDLARDEDRGLGAVLGASVGALRARRRRRLHRHGQHLDAAVRSAHRRALVHAGPTSRTSRRCRSRPRASRSGCGVSLDRARDSAPFFAAMGLFLMCFLGLGISLWPYIVPHSITLWNAAGVAQVAGLPPDRHAVPAADHLRVHGLVVLRVPRQGEGRRRLSLARVDPRWPHRRTHLCSRRGSRSRRYANRWWRARTSWRA